MGYNPHFLCRDRTKRHPNQQTDDSTYAQRASCSSAIHCVLPPCFLQSLILSVQNKSEVQTLVAQCTETRTIFNNSARDHPSTDGRGIGGFHQYVSPGRKDKPRLPRETGFHINAAALCQPTTGHHRDAGDPVPRSRVTDGRPARFICLIG